MSESKTAKEEVTVERANRKRDAAIEGLVAARARLDAAATAQRFASAASCDADEIARTTAEAREAEAAHASAASYVTAAETALANATELLATSHRALRIVDLQKGTSLEAYLASVEAERRGLVNALRADDITKVRDLSHAARLKTLEFNQRCGELRSLGIESVHNVDDHLTAYTMAKAEFDPLFLRDVVDGAAGPTGVSAVGYDDDYRADFAIMLTQRRAADAGAAVRDARFRRAVERGDTVGPSYAEVNRRRVHGLPAPVGTAMPDHGGRAHPVSAMLASARAMAARAMGGA